MSIGFTASLCARLLVADLVSGFEFFIGMGADFGDQRLVFFSGFPIPHGFASVTHEFVDGVDSDIALLVAEDHSTQHHFFRQLERF